MKKELVKGYMVGSENDDNLHCASEDALKTGRQGFSSYPPFIQTDQNKNKRKNIKIRPPQMPPMKSTETKRI